MLILFSRRLLITNTQFGLTKITSYLCKRRFVNVNLMENAAIANNVLIFFTRECFLKIKRINL